MYLLDCRRYTSPLHSLLNLLKLRKITERHCCLCLNEFECSGGRNISYLYRLLCCRSFIKNIQAIPNWLTAHVYPLTISWRRKTKFFRISFELSRCNFAHVSGLPYSWNLLFFFNHLECCGCYLSFYFILMLLMMKVVLLLCFIALW